MSDKLQVPRAARRTRVPARLRPAALPAALSAALSATLAGMAPPAFGLPEGANVVQGQAAVQQTAGNRLDIHQTTPRAAIDWTRFSIGANEQVVVNQPGRTAVLVNRVLGDDPSQIFGSLRANGTVWLVNPRGIVFGRDSRVDVGGLLASTLVILDEDLASGRLLLSRSPNGSGALRAEGRISAPDGSVVLVAPQLVQSGLVDARRIGLAAATDVQVDVEGDGLIFFNARNDGSLDARLQQLGTLRADGGLAELRAAARAGFADTVLNMDGIVQARSIGRRAGQIVIDGGSAGQTWVAGQLDASGSGADARGGQVTVLGDRIGLAGSARLDATGDAGGGAIRVGGDYQGANPALRNATAVLVQPGAVLDASAGQAGDGGLVVTWSDKATQFQGAADARGGARAGDGGLVEVSSKGHLDFRGTSDRRAPAGRTGTLLLDPETLEIVASGPDIDGGLTTQTLDLAAGTLGVAEYATAASKITAGAVASQLANGPVVLEAAKTLTVTKGFNAATGGNLTLQAGERVTVSDAIATAGAITLKTTATGGAVTTTADVTAGGALTITGSGGTHALSGTLAGSALAITGNVAIASGLTLTLAPTAGTSDIASVLGGAGSLAKEGDGTLTLAAANTYAGATTVRGGMLKIGTAGGLNPATRLVVDGGSFDLGGGALTVAGVALAGNGAIGNGTLTSTGAFDLRAGTVTAVLAGAVGLDKTTSGTVTLSGDNTYTGATAIDGGTLALGSAKALDGGGSIRFGGGTLQFSAQNTADYAARFSTQTGQAVRLDTNGQDVTLDFALGSAIGGLTKLGVGTLTLTADNAYTGTTTVAGGTLKIGAAERLADGSRLVVNGGTLDLGGFAEKVAGVQLAGGGVITHGTLTSTGTFDMRAGTANAVLAGGVGLTKTTAGTVTLGGDNTYTGTTAIDGGTLALGSARALDGGGAIRFGGGTLQFSAQNTADLATRFSTQTGQAVRLDTNGQDVTLGSPLVSAIGGLTKLGDGTLTLTAVNAYTGATTVAGGKLTIGTGGALAAGGSLVAEAGAFDLGGGAQTLDKVTLAGGTIANGTLTATSPFDMRAGTVTAVLAGGVGLDKTTAGTVVLGSHNSYTGTTRVQGGQLHLDHAQALGGSALVTDDAAGATVRLLRDSAVVSLAGGGARGGGVDLGAHALDVQGDSTATVFAGAIQGTGSLRKSGTGSLTLSGDNTYTGTTAIDGGTLALGSAKALDGGGAIRFGGGTLQFSAQNTADLAARLSTQTGQAVRLDTNGQDVTLGSALGSAIGGLTKLGDGTLTLTAVNAYTGATTVAGGTLKIGTGGGLDPATRLTVDGGRLDLGSGAVTVAGVALAGDGAIDNGTLTSTDTFDMRAGTVGAVLAGSVGLDKSTAGTVVLGNQNTHTGTTRVLGGELQLDHAQALGSSALVTDDTAGATVRLLRDSAVKSLAGGGAAGGGIVLGSHVLGVQGDGTATTYAGVVQGTGGLRKSGAGSLTLSGANTYTGTTEIVDGTLTLVAAGGLETGGSLVVRGGSLDLGGNSQAVHSVQQTGGLIANGTLTSATQYDMQAGTVTAVLAGSQGLKKESTGTLTLAAGNTYTGTTEIVDGTLALGAAGGLETGGSLVVRGGSLDLGGNSQSVQAVVQTGGLIANGTLTSATQYDMKAGTVTAVLAGSQGLKKSSAGTLTLDAANTYTGTTEIVDGTLALGGADRLEAGGSLVVRGGSLDLGGHGQSVQAVTQTGGLIANGTLTSATQFAMEGGAVTAVLAGSQGLKKESTGTLTLNGANTYTGTTEVDQGTLLLGASGRLDAGGRVEVGAGILDLGGTAQTLVAVQLAGGTIRNGTLTSTGSAFDLRAGTVDADLVGSRGLTKTTAGTVTLGGDNTYTGTTTIGGGTLALGSAKALDGGGVIRFGGGTLQFSAQNTVDYAARFRTQANQVVRLDTNGQDVTLASTLVGTIGGLAKLGDGTLTLAAANASTGTTTVSAGTLALAGHERLANAGSLVVDGGTLDLGGFTETVAAVRLDGGLIRNGTLASSTRFDMRAGTVDAVLAGAVGLDKTTAGVLTLGQANAYTGVTHVQGGTLVLDHAQVLAASPLLLDDTAGAGVRLLRDVTVLALAGGGAAGGGVDLGSAVLHVADNGTASDFAGVLRGSGGLHKAGGGSLTLSGENTYTGTTTVSDGSLVLGADQRLSDASRLVVQGGTLDLGGFAQTLAGVQLAGGMIANGTLTSLGRFEMQHGTVDAVLDGTAGLRKSTGGVVTLTAANAYTGTTEVDEGTLVLQGDQRLAGAGQLAVRGGVLDLGAGSQTLAGVQQTGGWIVQGQLRSDTAFDMQAGEVQADLGGSAGLTKSGTGTLTLRSPSSYTGATTVADGVLLLAGSQHLAADGTLVVTGGRFDLGGHSQALAGVQLDGGTVANGLLASSSAFDLRAGTVDAVLDGLMGATKTTTGTVTLNSVAAYSGATTVAGGVLRLGGDDRLPATGQLAVSGGTFDLGGFGQTLAGVQQTGGAIANGRLTSWTDFDLQAGDVHAVLDGAVGLAKTGAGMLTLHAANTYTGTTTVADGTLRLGGPDRLAGSGSLVVSGGTLDLGGFGQTLAGVQQTGGLITHGTLTSQTTFDLQAGAVDAVLDGTAGLSKTSGGTATLSGANTYTGTTVVADGVLRLAGTDRLAVSGTLVVSGGTLDLVGGRQTLAGVQQTGGAIANGSLTSGTTFDMQAGDVQAALVGSVGLDKTGSGTLVLSGANTYTGPTTVAEGTLQLGAAQALPAAGRLVVQGGTFDLGGLAQTLAAVQQTGGVITHGTLTSGSDFDLQAGSVDAVLAGTAGLLKDGPGTLTLGGANTYTGTTTVAAGTLQLAGDQRLAAGSRLVVAGGLLDLGGGTQAVAGVQQTGGWITHGTLDSATAFDMQSGGSDAVLAGTAGLDKTGLGAVSLLGANTYTGATTVADGVLTLVGSQRLAAAGTLVVQGGLLDLYGGEQALAGVQQTGGQITGGTLRSATAFDMRAGFVDAVLAGTAGLTKSGSGTLTLFGANTYTGTTTVADGTLVLAGPDRLDPAGRLLVSGGLLDLGGFAHTLAGVQQTGGTVAGGALVSGSDFQMQAGTVDAVLAGDVGLAKTGAGTLQLNAAVAYTGATSVADGTLLLGAAERLPDTGRLIVSGGTLDLGGLVQTLAGLQQTGGRVTHGTVIGRSNFDLQAGLVDAVLDGSVGLDKTGTGTLTLAGAATYTGATTVRDGTLVLAGNQLLPATGSLVVEGGALDLGGLAQTFAAVRLAGGAVRHGTLTSLTTFDLQDGAVDAELAGFAGAVKSGAGTVTIQAPANYAGATVVSDGVLRLGGDQRLAAAGNLVVDGGTFDLGGFAQDLFAVRQTGGSIANGTLASPTVFDLRAGEVQAALAGPALLFKTGPGVLTLRGANLYTGTTIVSDGVLQLGADQRLPPAGRLEVQGGQLDLGGFRQTMAAVQQTGGVIAHGVLASQTAFDLQHGQVDAVLDGTAGLTKTGFGTVLLNAANTYTGPTTVADGVLQLGGPDRLASAGTLVVSGGVLDLGGFGQTLAGVQQTGGWIANGTLTSLSAFDLRNGTVDAVLAGTAGLTKSGFGAVLLNGANTYTGTTTVADGVLQLGGPDRLASAGTLVVSGGVLDLGGFGQTLAGVQQTGGWIAHGTLTSLSAFDLQAGSSDAVLAGTAGLSKTGPGTVVLVGASTYTGTTTVADGVLVLAGDQRLADAGQLAVHGGVLDLGGAAQTLAGVQQTGGVITNGTLTSLGAFDLQAGTVDAVLAGSAGLTKTSGGTVLLNAANTVTGAVRVDDGVLQLGGDQRLAAAGSLVVDGGRFDLGGFSQTLAGVQLTGGTIVRGTLTSLTAFDLQQGTVDAVLAGTAGLTKSGPGTVLLNGAATDTGTTTLVDGTLLLGGNDRLLSSGQLVVSGGSLDLGGYSQTLAGVQLRSGWIGHGTLTSLSDVDLRGGTVDGVLAGTAGVTKSGADLAALFGENTYTGATTVADGTLLLGGNDRLATAGRLVVRGGTLDLGGFGQTMAGVQVTGGAVANGTLTSQSTFDLQQGMVGAVLAGNAGLTKSSTGTVTLNAANTVTGTTTVAGGTLRLGGDDRLATAGTLVVSGGTLDLGGFGQALAGVQQTGGLLTGGTLTSATVVDLQAGTVDAVLAGSAGFLKTTAGTTLLTAATTGSGTATVADGVLQLGAADRLADGAPLVVSGGTLDLGGFSDTVAGLRQTGGIVANGTLTSLANVDLRAGTVQAVLAGSAGLDKTGAGTARLDGANTFTGTTTLHDGTLRLGAPERLADAARLVVRGGTLDLGGFTETVAGVRQSGGLVANGTLRSASAFDMQGGTASAVLAGTAGLDKTGADAVALEGANTYTGTTTVSGGTLVLGAADRLADGGTLLVSGGTLDLGGFAQTVTAVRQTGGTIANGTLASRTAFDMQAGSADAVLAGSAGLTKSSAGTLTLNAANTYTGTTTVAGGVLLLGGDQRLAGAGTLVLSGGTLDLGGFAQSLAGVQQTGGTLAHGTLTSQTAFDLQAGTVDAVLAGIAGLAKTTAGTVVLNAANTVTGTALVSDGVLQLGAHERLADASRLVITGGRVDGGGFTETLAGVQLAGGRLSHGTLVSTSAFDLQAGSVDAVLAGTAGLTKSGAGTVTLEAANTVTGTATVADGTLVLADAQRLAAGSRLVVSGGTLDLGGFAQSLAGVQLAGGSIAHGTLTSAAAVDAQAGVVDAVLAGTAGLTKTGAGTVTLNAANTATGTFAVAAGTLRLGAADRLADGARLAVSGGTLDLGGFADTVAGVQQTGGRVHNGTLTSASTVDLQAGTLDAVLAGTAGLAKTGTGTATLGGANTATGTTTVTEGTLLLSAANRLADAGSVVVNGGTLDLGGFAETVAGLRLAGGGVRNGTLTSTSAADLQAGTVDAVLAGSAGLAKTTAGTVLLNAANPVTGTTTVAGGTLQLGAAQRLPDAAQLVVSGGTLDLGGFGQTLASVRLAGGSIARGTLTSASAFDLRAGTVDAVLAGTAGIDKTTAGTVTLNAANTVTGTTTVGAGTLLLGAAERLSDASRLVVVGGTLDLGGFSETVAAVRQTGGRIDHGTLASSTAFDLLAGSVGAVLAGSVGLDKTGPGTVVLEAANTYTGDTTVREGTLRLGAADRLADASRLVVQGGTFDLGGFAETVAGVRLADGLLTNGTLTSTSPFDLQAGTASAVLAGTVGIDKTTAGTVTLLGDNTARGAVTVSAGTLRLGASERLSDAVRLVVRGGSVDLAGFTETVDAVQQSGGTLADTGGTGRLVSSTGFDIEAGRIGASLHSPQGLRKTGDGVLAITAGHIDPTTLTLDGGTLTLAAAGATLSGALVVNAGTLDLGGSTQSVAGLQQNGGLVTHGTLASDSTFDLRAGTVSAVLDGSQGLRKSTGGTTVLSGANTYSGLTQVDAGVLHLDGAQRLAAGGDANIAASRARVAEGAVLLLNGPQVLFQVQMDGQLTGTGQLDTIGTRSTSGRFDLPVTADLLDISGSTQINADATITRLRVFDGGRLELGASGLLRATDTLDVAAAGRVTLGSAQRVGTLNLAGTLDGTGLLGATQVNLQGGQVLAPLGGGALASTGNSLLNAPAAVDTVAVHGGTLRTGALGQFTARPVVQVDAGASLALGSDAVLGSLAGAGNVQLDRSSLRTGSAGDSRFDGVLSGSGGLLKDGSGRFDLGGANSFTGGTVVAAGTLALRGNERLADAGTVQVDAGATLRLDGTETIAALALAGTLDGSGTLNAARYAFQAGRTLAGVALGGGALTADGDSRLGGAAAVDSIAVDSGTLTLAAGSTRALPVTRVAAGAVLALQGDNTLGSLSGAGRVALGSATLTTGAAGSSSFDGAISGSGGLVKRGDGVFTLAADSTYTGATTVAAGTLALAGPAAGAQAAAAPQAATAQATTAQATAPGQRLSDATAVTVQPGATLQLGGDETVASLLLQGTLAGSGALTAATYRLDGGTALADLGAGALTSVGASQIAGRSAASTVDVQAGQLRLAVADRLADGTAVSVARDARLTLAGDDRVDSLALHGTLDGSGTLRTRSTTLDGGQVLADLAADRLDSRGTSRLQGQASADQLTLQDGTLTLAAADRLPGLPAVTVQAGAQLALQGDQTLGSLAGSGAVDLGSFTLATGARADSTFAGAIGGSGGLVKQGSATTFALTGASTYTGTTRVATGTLSLGDGGAGGSLATSGFVVDGVLQVRHAGTVRLEQPVSGSGSLEQAGPAADSTLVLRGSNKTQAGATRVRSGRLVTEGDEALSDAGALVVDAGAALVLGGAETVASVSAPGTVDVASRLSAAGPMVFGGALRAAGSTPLRLEAASIEALNAGNRLGENLALRTPGSVQLNAGSDANGRLTLSLGEVQVGGGGRIEASTLVLNGEVSLRGATLVLDVDRGEVLVEPTGDLLGKLTPAGRQIALTQDVLTQGPDGRITTDDGGGLRVDASRGGSVALLGEGNRFAGDGLAVVVGPAGLAWKPNLAARTGNLELSVQNQVRVHGTQVDIGGAGIQADLVTLRAGGVATRGDAAIVARLPYDNQTGTTQSVPALTFDLTELAFNTPGSHGAPGEGIRIDVGSRLFGDRTLLPLDAGYVAVLPQNGARGGTAVLLSGPQVANGGYSFFYSGAGQQGQIPVFYNGVTALTPQVSGSISATLSVSEGARKERFDDAVRVENVALRLRAGVIAEVGPGRPATVNTGPMDGLRPPTCAAVPGGLVCK